MAGSGCMSPQYRERLEKDEFFQNFIKFSQTSSQIAADWIQAWQVKTGKDFLEEVKKKDGKYKYDVFTSIIKSRHDEFYKGIKPTTQAFGVSFNALHRDLSAQQITDAIQLIEHMCYQLFEVYKRNGTYSSFEEFLSGGEVKLYDEIYENLGWGLKERKIAGKDEIVHVMHPAFTINENDKNSDVRTTDKGRIIISDKELDLLKKVLSRNNYDTLWHLAKISVKTNLGVTVGSERTIGNNLEEIGEYLEVLDKGENDENSQFNREESTKEAWQEVKEFIKPMKQLSKDVRRMLSHIPQFDTNGKIAMSTFGVPRFESPHVIHRKLSKILIGVKSERKMIKLLKEAEAGYYGEKEYGDKQTSYILQQVDYTAEPSANNELRTKLFQDMQRTAMMYAVAKIKRFGRNIYRRISFINTASNQIGNQILYGYRSQLSSNVNTIATNLTIFDETGKLKQGALKSAKSIASNLLVETEGNPEERTKKFFKNYSNKQQLSIVLNALKALGIPHDITSINRLLRGKSYDKYVLINNLYDVFSFIGRHTNEDTTMYDVITNPAVGDQKTGQEIIMRSLSQVLRIANENNMVAQSTFRMTGSYMNPTKGFVEYQTAQLRGFLTDMFDALQEAKELTLEESNIENGRIKVNYVQKYIEDHFLQDPMFVEYEEQTDDSKPKYKKDKDGFPIIRNAWLNELWRSANSIESLKSPNSFINRFSHYQFVGSEKDFDEKFTTNNSDWKTWEDFNGMQHMALLMDAYVQAYRTNDIQGIYKDQYADYPTFILGDSGKLKFIRSRRYKVRSESKEESVMQHLEQVVFQEIDFSKNMYDFQNQLIANGKKPISQLAPSKLLVDYPQGKVFYKIQSFPELNNLLYQKAIENGVDFSKDQAAVADQLGLILKNNLSQWLENIMKDRLLSFKEKCKKEGVLKSEKVTSKESGKEYEIYPNLPLGKDSGYAWLTDGSEDAKIQNEKELNRFLEDFYYNSTLAMVEQIQITTLSPAFYPNSVEMQKRMKQIHANGRRPSLEAIDRNGKPYMMRNGHYNTMMDYILLNDVLGNPSQAQNEDFMNAVAYTHGRYTQEYYKYIAKHPEATKQEKDAEAIRIGKQSSQYQTFAASSYTDGQGYRTLEGYRKVKGALGEWSDQDEDYYERILQIRQNHKDGSEWTKEEQIEVANMMASWQPIKPFTYGMQTIQQVTDGVGRVVRIPTQIKCSECLIIPELMPVNSKLRTIGQYLENKQLDCAYYDSAVKVGAFGQAETQYTENPDNSVKRNNDGEVTEDSGIWNPQLKKQLKAGQTFELMSIERLSEILNGEEPFLSPTRHSLSYEYYAEQNTVPEHTYNSRTIGTQLRKIFFDGLSNIELDENGRPTGNFIDYSSYVDNNLVTLPDGKKASLSSKEQLIKFYDSLHCANVLAQFEGIVKIIENDKTLSKELQKIAQRSSNDQLGKLIMYAVHRSLVDPNQMEFSIPLFENSMEHDAAATLISIFKKASTQLQIQGGSLVQASAYGIGKINYIKSTGNYVEQSLQVHCDENHNILYSECEVPFVQEYTDKFGKKVKLRFEDYCDEDGSLIQVPVKKKDENNKEVVEYISKLERDFPGSTEMICYRIPSEKDYSAVVLKVKRFTKPIEGGVIKLPVQITSITGADFDIDKMYLMRPQYVQRQDATTLDEFISKKYKKEFLGKVWEDVYTNRYFGVDGQQIKSALNFLRERFIDEHHITNPNDKRIPSLNSFWDEAVEKFPSAFTNEKGMIHANKQEFFEKAVRNFDKDFKTGLKDNFNTSQQFKWYTYDYDKPVDKQIRDKKIRGVKTDVVVRNNMMLQLVKKRLQDPQTMISRTTPGGFVHAEDGAEDIRYLTYADKNYINGDQFDWDRFEQLKKDNPDPNESLNYADPFTLVEYNKQNQIAAKLVGTFANLNSFVQMLNSLEDAKLKNPVKMFGRTVDSIVTGRDENGTNESFRNSTLFVAEMLAAAVDSVKNPTLKFLNITQSTAYVAGLMAMTGYTHREIGIFLNQPIVKEVTNYCEQNNCSLIAAIRNISAEYYTENGKVATKESSDKYANNLTEGKLLERLVGGEEKNSIANNKNNESFMKHQFSVLSALQDLTKTSLVLKSYVSASKMTSANSIQSTYGSLYSIMQAAEALNNVSKDDVLITLYPYNSEGVVSPIDTNLDIEDSNYMTNVLNSVFPIEQVIYDTVKKFVDKTQKFFPYDKNIFKNAREFFKTANKEEAAVLQPKTIDAIHRYVQNYCIENIVDIPTLFGNATISMGKDTYDADVYFLQKFPKEFQRFLNANAKQYPTLHRCLSLDQNGRLILNYGYNKDSDKDAFTAEWRSLILNNQHHVTPMLNVGTALYLYNFHASKFNFGATTFDHLMPQDQLPNMVIGYIPDIVNKTLRPLTYKEALDRIKEDEELDINDDLIITFLKDNYNNNELVKQIFNYEQAAHFGEKNIEIDTGEEDEVNEFSFLKLKTNKDDKTVTYPLAIHVNDTLFVAYDKGGNIQNTVEAGDTIIYKPFKTTQEIQTTKTNEENIPIEGTFLEPISWDNLSSVTTKDVVYDIMQDLMNNMIETTRGDEININQYLDFCRGIVEKMKNDDVDASSIHLVQKSFNALQKAYSIYNEGGILSTEHTKLIMQANTVTILQSFVNTLCPGINLLNGEQRNAIYELVLGRFSTDEGEVVDFSKSSFEDIKNQVIESLLENRLQIEETVDTVKHARQLYTILQEDDGSKPLLENGETEVNQACRR